MDKYGPLIVLMVFLLLASVACQPRATRAPTLTLPPTLRPLAVAGGSVTPLPTLPLKPAAAPTLPSTPTRPASTAAAPARSKTMLAPAGALGLIQTQSGMWAVRADGSGLARLAAEDVLAPASLQVGASPAGDWLAFITAANAKRWQGVNLTLLKLPEGQDRVQLPLLPPDFILGVPGATTDSLTEGARAIMETPGSLAWSPDGRQLAFVGAQDGVSSDLYVYSTGTGKTTRLTDGPSQAYQPAWSPNGRYIVHAGVSSFGTGAGYAMAGVWAARADDTGVKSLYKPTGGGETFVGWVGSSTLLVHSWSVTCGASNLRWLDIETGQAQMLWEGCFSSVALDPDSQAVLLAVDRLVAESNKDGRAGVFLLKPERQSQRFSGTYRIFGTQRVLDDGAVLSWSSEGQVFFAQLKVGWAAVRPEGEIVRIELAGLTRPVAAPGGQVWAWSGATTDPGVWIGRLGAPGQRIFPANAVGLSWAPTSEAAYDAFSTGTLFFFSNGLYRASAPDFEPLLVDGALRPAGDEGIVWVRP